jgi:cell shape-determining protein MreC
VFPFGLPVARVTKVQRDPALPLAQIHAVPLAGIENDREVLFVWGRPNVPASVASPEALAVDAPAPAPAPAQQAPPKPAPPKPAPAQPAPSKPMAGTP